MFYGIQGDKVTSHNSTVWHNGQMNESIKKIHHFKLSFLCGMGETSWLFLRYSILIIVTLLCLPELLSPKFWLNVPHLSFLTPLLSPVSGKYHSTVNSFVITFNFNYLFCMVGDQSHAKQSLYHWATRQPQVFLDSVYVWVFVVLFFSAWLTFHWTNLMHPSKWQDFIVPCGWISLISHFI